MKTLSTIITLTFALALSLSLDQMALAQEPQRTDISPPPNSHLTPLTQTISITYNQDISRATVSTQTFVVQARQTGLLTQTYDVVNGTISLRPTLPFKPGELIQVTATTGTLSVNGQGPITPTVWQFRGRASGLNAVYTDSGQPIGNSDSRAVALGDLDGDGDLDAFVANYLNQPNQVWLNNGLGIFQEGDLTDIASSTDIALGDLDGDGDLDAFITNWDGQPNEIWLNNGEGLFTDSGQSLGDSSTHGVALGDLDGDGDLDAFVANFDQDKIWLNDGDGIFIDSGQFSGDTTFSYAVDLGDLDGDGDLDAVVGSCASRISNCVNARVLLNNGEGVFNVLRDNNGADIFNTQRIDHLGRIIGNIFEFDSYDVALGDLDGDGDLDVLFGTQTGFQSWLYSGRSRIFESSQTANLGQSVVGYSVDLGDLDGDGTLDAFFTAGLLDRVNNNVLRPNRVWLNNGSGRFSDSNQRLGHRNSYDVALGDLDGDGDLDAFVANEGGEDKVWLNSSQVEVRPRYLRLNEPNGSDTFSVSLSTDPLPTSIVTMTLSSQSDECRFSPSTLSLDSSNWQIGRTVAVTAVDDLVADGPQDCLIETNVSSDDPDFDGTAAADIIVTVEDDDRAGLEFSSLSLSETAESGTFSLTLTSEPMDVVTLTLSSLSDECLFSPSTFSLDQSNWRMGRTVVVTAVDDLVVDGPQACLIDTSVSSSGADYNGLMDTATVMVIDDEVAGLQFSPLSLSEPAESGTFSLTLTSEPLDTVTLTLSSQSDQCRFSPSTLSLAQSNWQIGRTVAVTAVDDLVVDGPQDCLIAMSVSSSKIDYAGLVMTATVVVADEDVAALQFNSPRLFEPFGSGILSVTLATEPLATVTLTLSSESDECLFAPSTLSLDGDTWRSGSSVIVTAIDDPVVDGPQDCLIVTSVLSSGADYAGLVTTATVVVQDDDVISGYLNPWDLSLNEPAESGIISLYLFTEPIGVVTVTLSSESDECRFSPSTLSLDQSDWRMIRTITITAEDDLVTDGRQACLISFNFSSDKSDYDGFRFFVTVTINDDDMTGVQFSPDSPPATIINEPDENRRISVTLTSEPIGVVMLTLSSESDECIFSPNSLSFDRNTWQVGHTLIVTAEDDLVRDGIGSCLIEASVSSDAADYNNLEVEGLDFIVGDDEVAGVQFSPDSLPAIIINEPDENRHISVTLTSEPMGVVMLTLSSESDECIFSPNSLSFDRNTWQVGHTLIVTAEDDLVRDGAESCLIKTSVRSDAADYDNLEVEGIDFVVDDNEVPGLTYTPSSLSISEPDESATLSLALRTQPLGMVTITMNSQSDACHLAPNTINLDRNTWHKGQIVRVTAVDDQVVDGEQVCLTATDIRINSNEPDYNGLVTTVTVVVQDDDVAGVRINPPSLSLSEPDGLGVVTLSLNTQPQGLVTVTLSPQGDECQVTPNRVHLDSLSWQSGRPVTVTVVDDQIDDGPQVCLISTFVRSDAADYDGLEAADVSVIVQDDDGPGVRISPPSLSLSEPDESGVIILSLNTQPLGLVTATLSTQSDECQVTPNRVHLDSLSWQNGRSVTVTVVDDQIDDGSQACLISTFVRSEAADYDGLEAADVSVTVQDDDEAGITINPPSLSLSEPDESGVITLSLNTQPLSLVTITLNTQSDECRPYPSSLYFAETSWQNGRSVTVTVVDDLVVDGSQVCLIFMTSRSDTPDYLSVSSSITVTVQDDERRPEVASIYLPMILKNFPEPPTPTPTPTNTPTLTPTPTNTPTPTSTAVLLPDLIVESLVATQNDLRLVIRNQGTGPVDRPFWVDTYINPQTPPTETNQDWVSLNSDGGIIWGVTSDYLPIQAGQSLSLTLSHPTLDSTLSSPLPLSILVNTPVYAQVDSHNTDDPDNGGVIEVNEDNNIFGPILSIDVVSRLTFTGERILFEGLPPRQD